MDEYRIHITLKNGKSYAASKTEARIRFKPFLKQIATANLQHRLADGSWRDGPRVAFHDGSFDVLFGAVVQEGRV
jgi:hypothetical protein